MRFVIPSYLSVSLFLFGEFSRAQVNSPPNLVANPGCSTAESIVQSCAPKLGAQATVTSAVFGCICYDGLGSYAPTIYDNAASSCSEYLVSVLSTTGNAFVAYAAGFCTDTAFAPVKTGPPATTPSVTGIGAGASGSGSTPAQTVISTSASVIPGGNIATSNSSPTTSASITSAASPGVTEGSSSSSSSGSASASGAGGSVSSTSSKAGGTKITTAVGESSIWSLFGSLLAAIFIF